MMPLILIFFLYKLWVSKCNSDQTFKLHQAVYLQSIDNTYHPTYWQKNYSSHQPVSQKLTIKNFIITMHTWLVVGTAESRWGIEDALLWRIWTGLLMNWTPGSVDGTLPMCTGRLTVVDAGRRSPASCWPAAVTADDTPMDIGCEDRTPWHNSSANTWQEQFGFVITHWS